MGEVEIDAQERAGARVDERDALPVGSFDVARRRELQTDDSSMLIRFQSTRHEAVVFPEHRICEDWQQEKRRREIAAFVLQNITRPIVRLPAVGAERLS